MLKNKLWFITLLLGSLLLATTVLAAPTPPVAPATQGRPAPAQVHRLRQGDRQPVNPLMPQINALMEQEQKQLATLNLRARQSTDSQAGRAIQQEIGRVKRHTERRILELQLDYARSQDHQQAVALLEQAIASLDAPPPPPIHVERNIPDTHQR